MLLQRDPVQEAAVVLLRGVLGLRSTEDGVAIKSLRDISTEKDNLPHRCHIIFKLLSGMLENGDF